MSDTKKKDEKEHHAEHEGGHAEGGSAALSRPVGSPPPVPTAAPPAKPAKEGKDKETPRGDKESKPKEKKKKSTIREKKKIQRKALDGEKDNEKTKHIEESIDIPVTPSDPGTHFCSFPLQKIANFVYVHVTTDNHWETVRCSSDTVASPRSKHTSVYYKGK